MIYRWWLNTEGVLIIQFHKAISINVAIFVKKKTAWLNDHDGQRRMDYFPCRMHALM